MNERVLELARQAGLKKEHGSDREYIGDFDWRKFAELIANECARLAMTQHHSTSPEDYDDMSPYDQGCDDIASAISGLIRVTFGIKEDPDEDSIETCPRCGDEWSGTSCGINDCGWIVGDKQ